jgi:thiamine biosynthesis protein ThiI
MRDQYLIKIGEISLKGGNRSYFEKSLKQNIRAALPGREVRISGREGRFYLRSRDAEEQEVRQALSRTFGVVGFTRTRKSEKSLEALKEETYRLVEEMASELPPGKTEASFKIEARRTDKSFPLNSYQIACELGAYLAEEFPFLSVDVRNPDWTISVEIREHSYVYGQLWPGPGGLPVGTAGKGILMLSGGIDSPVAGYMMAKRGLDLEAVYFHTYPYTSDEALEKVKTLSGILSPYLRGLTLHVVPFTDFQMRLAERAEAEEITLLMRAGMVKIAEMLAADIGAGCLVSGEALGQVASQTQESMRFTGSVSSLPVFRPLIGLDKEEIISRARTIGTFSTSILPYEDCCTIFTPEHPLVKPDYQRMREAWERLEADELLQRAKDDTEQVKLSQDEVRQV